MRRIVPALMALAGGRLVTEGLAMTDVEGVGILQANGAKGTYKGLTITNTHGGSDNRSWTGVWVQAVQGTLAAPAFELLPAEDGSPSMIENIGEAAVITHDVSGIRVEGSELAKTELRDVILTGVETGRVPMGDGLHLVDTVKDIDLKTLDLAGNERAGIRVEGGSQAFENVTATGVNVSGGVGEGGSVIGQFGVVVTGVTGTDTFPGSVTVATPELATADEQVRLGQVLAPKVSEAIKEGSMPNLGTDGLIGANGMVGTFGITGAQQ